MDKCGQSFQYQSGSSMKDEVNRVLQQHNREGVRYHEGIPDFSPFSKGRVKMSVYEMMKQYVLGRGRRTDLHAFADELLAQSWNKRLNRMMGKVPKQASPTKNGKFCGADVKRFRQEQNYIWHEQNNMKVMELVPSVISNFFLHLGGIGEINIIFENEGKTGLLNRKLESNEPPDAPAMNHSLLGTLIHGGSYWENAMLFSFFGKESVMGVHVNCHDGGAIEENQEEAIRHFTGLGQELGGICEAAVREYCQRMLEGGDAPQPELVVADRDHISHYSVIFPVFQRAPTWGLAASVAWSDKGLGVKFVRDEIVEVGMENILV